MELWRMQSKWQWRGHIPWCYTLRFDGLKSKTNVSGLTPCHMPFTYTTTRQISRADYLQWKSGWRQSQITWHFKTYMYGGCQPMSSSQRYAMDLNYQSGIHEQGGDNSWDTVQIMPVLSVLFWISEWISNATVSCGARWPVRNSLHRWSGSSTRMVWVVYAESL